MQKNKLEAFQIYLIEEEKSLLTIEKYMRSMLSSVNSYLVFVGRSDCRVKTLRLQRSVYCAEEKELTREEYKKLLQAAKNDKVLALLMQTIAVTGIRVSEHRFITVEAARNGKAEVRCKGKVRTILIPRRLCKELLGYAKKCGLRSGSIFLSRDGNPLHRSRKEKMPLLYIT